MVRQVYHSLLDNIELLIGRREKAVPPRRLARHTGMGTGPQAEASIRRLLELAELKPDVAVLEVGCGCGKSARLLARRLARSGGYWGFDVDAESIAWCQRNIEAEHPNFYFRVADVYDQIFQPKGRFKPASYRFPYLDDYFDRVLVPAAFTRMQCAEIRNYLAQIGRVLKPGGRCVVSLFLLNEQSKRLLEDGLGKVHLSLGLADRLFSQRIRATAPIGHEEDFVRECCAGHGLNVVEPIDYGGWCGREESSHQPDFLVAVKALDAAGADNIAWS